MLEVLGKEFCGIINYLKEAENDEYKGFLLADKEIIIKLLAHNGYETVDNKLKFWKALKWIDTDKNRYTKRVRQETKIKLNLEIYEVISKLIIG